MPQLLRAFLACSTTLKLPKGSTTKLNMRRAHLHISSAVCGGYILSSRIITPRSSRYQPVVQDPYSLFIIHFLSHFPLLRTRLSSNTWGGFEEERARSLPSKESNLETRIRLLLNAVHTDSVIMCSSRQKIQ